MHHPNLMHYEYDYTRTRSESAKKPHSRSHKMAEAISEEVNKLGRRTSTTSRNPKQKLQTIYDFITNRTEVYSIYSASQNLSSALNDPNNREIDLFTKTWGESFIPHAPVPPSSLPNIEITDFIRYLKETASVSGRGWVGVVTFSSSHRAENLIG